MKKNILIITAVGLFAFLLAFNLTILNSTNGTTGDIGFFSEANASPYPEHCGRCEEHVSVPEKDYCDFTFQVYYGCMGNDGTKCEDDYQWNCMYAVED
jgi:hypothetical protein